VNSTEIRVANRELAVGMTRMREWLDRHRFPPAVFRYDHVDGAVIIHVDFPVEQEAAAFARAFGGMLIR
jgi:hypothetical protein